MNEVQFELTINNETYIVGPSVCEKLVKQEGDFEFNGLIEYLENGDAMYKRVKYKVGANFSIHKK